MNVRAVGAPIRRSLMSHVDLHLSCDSIPPLVEIHSSLLCSLEFLLSHAISDNSEALSAHSVPVIMAGMGCLYSYSSMTTRSTVLDDHDDENDCSRRPSVHTFVEIKLSFPKGENSGHDSHTPQSKKSRYKSFTDLSRHCSAMLPRSAKRDAPPLRLRFFLCDPSR